MNAIERLCSLLDARMSCPCPDCDYVRDLESVDALYQAAKAVADYDPFCKNAATEWGDRRRTLAAAVRRVEGQA